MNWKKIFTKRTLTVAVFGVFALSTFTSCHRDGCPGQITKAPVEQVKNC
jgi:hypothetical protein